MRITRGIIAIFCIVIIGWLRRIVGRRLIRGFRLLAFYRARLLLGFPIVIVAHVVLECGFVLKWRARIVVREGVRCQPLVLRDLSAVVNYLFVEVGFVLRHSVFQRGFLAKEILELEGFAHCAYHRLSHLVLLLALVLVSVLCHVFNYWIYYLILSVIYHLCQKSPQRSCWAPCLTQEPNTWVSRKKPFLSWRAPFNSLTWQTLAVTLSTSSNGRSSKSTLSAWKSSFIKFKIFNFIFRHICHCYRRKSSWYSSICCSKRIPKWGSVLSKWL